MTAHEEWTTLLAKQGEIGSEFLDADGVLIQISSAVHYTRNREGSWNTDRWGIVVGLAKTAKWDYETNAWSEDQFDYSVQVVRPYVAISSREGVHDEFYCSPTSLRVIR